MTETFRTVLDANEYDRIIWIQVSHNVTITLVELALRNNIEM